MTVKNKKKYVKRCDTCVASCICGKAWPKEELKKKKAKSQMTGVDITLQYNTAMITEEEMEELADFVKRAKDYGCGCEEEKGDENGD